MNGNASGNANNNNDVFSTSGDFNDLFGEMSSSTVEETRLCSVDECNQRMRELEALAPSYRFDDYYTVRNRRNRVAGVSEQQMKEKLVRTMRINLQEFKREKAVQQIDEQWLAVREQRTLLSKIERRSKKRGRGTDDDNRSTTSSFSSRRQRRRMDEGADNCPICQDSLAVGPTVNLPCGHNLHSVCNRDLLGNGDVRCPTCRQCTLCPAGECSACPECHQREGHSNSCLRIVQGPPSPNDSISSLAGRFGGAMMN
jgi:hypothetical protein